MEWDTPPATPLGVSGWDKHVSLCKDSFGRCYSTLFEGDSPDLGIAPTFGEVKNELARAEPADDDFGDWCSYLPEWSSQHNSALPTHAAFSRLDELSVQGVTVGYHVNEAGSKTLAELEPAMEDKHFVGALLSDLVATERQLPTEAEDLALRVLQGTTPFEGDSAENYYRLGEMICKFKAEGYLRKVARSTFTTILQHTISRWASSKESIAAARIATAALYNEPWDWWSPQMFNDAMEINEGEEDKQARLARMACMLFCDIYAPGLSTNRLRPDFTAWVPDITAPAREFCRAVRVDGEGFMQALDVGAKRVKGETLPWARQVLITHGTTAISVLGQVAAGGAVSATLLAAAGVAMDWYFGERATHRLGPLRESYNPGVTFVSRAKEYFVVGAALSDEVYDTTTHTQIVRIDPFFFSAKNDFSKLKDDTAAQRTLANSLIPPLIQNITTMNKSIIQIPATISDESARHIQEAMPSFYFRIVNRSHSHAELWTVRRGFELLTSQHLSSTDSVGNVVMVGGNVRQVSKIPNVVANYGPIMTGRDEARHRLKGTFNQRQLFSQLNIQECFGEKPKLFQKGVAVSFYSAQDMGKENFVKAMIASGICKAYVAVNIPIIMMDHRITEWEDRVLNSRFRKEGDKLYMTPMLMPVAGYCNSFTQTMSWVKPIKPIWGFDVTISTVSQVSSSYLFEIDVGHGPQEEHDTIWKMPDAGHYVLHDLTRNHDEAFRYYTVPAEKFEMVVKYVVQLNGAKNVVEATAGRILGLEAQIKIGGTVLERSWYQNHKNFVSTMIHAITCAGIDKSDALLMLGRLRTHFTDKEKRGIFQKVYEGYMKLLDRTILPSRWRWEKDLRLPTKTSRGASDYEVVTHWTAHQAGGRGSAKPRQKRRLEQENDDEGTVALLTHPSKTVKWEDEGYVSREQLDDSDADTVSDTSSRAEKEDAVADDSKPEVIKPQLADRMLKWLGKPSSSGDHLAQSKDDLRLGPHKPTALTQRLVVPQDFLTRAMTNSVFDPEGPILFGNSGGSLSDQRFHSEIASLEDLKVALEGNRELTAPDKGGVEVIGAAIDRQPRDADFPATLLRPIPHAEPNNGLEQLENTFYSEVTDEDSVRLPSLLVDGIAGSAKSTLARKYIKEYRVSAAIVCPSRKLADDWRRQKAGTVVTKHKLTLKTLRGRSLLVIDEVFAYTKQELYTLLWKAKAAGVKVLALGDRRQQYEDGGELTIDDLCFLGMPVLRMCVSNTMPVDALLVAVWAADADPQRDLFQTRNGRVHSIYLRQKDQPGDEELVPRHVQAEDWLVAKDRLQIPLNYINLTEEQAGFSGQPDNWLSVSRAQGLRARNFLLLGTAQAMVEKWFAQQPGLFYVACSRHSESMLYLCDQYDLSRLSGLNFEDSLSVNGRLAVLSNREKFDSPSFVLKAVIPRESRILTELVKRGHSPQSVKFVSGGPIREDWRPWPKFATGCPEVATEVFKTATDRLVGAQVPYTETLAVTKPVYQAAMGLSSIRRPDTWAGEKVNAFFPGLSRVAVLQNSRDELLDQKNVIERTARPRVIDESEFRVRAQASALYETFKEVFFNTEGELHLSTEPSAMDWGETRGHDFTSKLENSDHYGVTAFSTRSMGFLKTQTKVKLKRTFAMEENYGQTVLASPADFNSIFGPWSKMVMRNARLLIRPGVVIDSGFSDKELARHFRRHGVLPRFEEENYQADVKRQDTSHTPVTLRLFTLFLKDLGLPEELADLYGKHSTHYQYQSMKAGLYRGEAAYNLGSGDPFTLFRNIVEVMTVMVERYGNGLAEANMVIKGDDFLSDKIFSILPVTVPEVRATQLTEDFNKPPYHAGRFFLSDDVVPDPVRMIAKILTKRTADIQRVKQLAESFYDRYIPLTDFSFHKMAKFVVEAYSDFEPEFSLGALELYHVLRDRNLFFMLLSEEDVPESEKLVVLDSPEDCAANAARWFVPNGELDSLVRDESAEVVEATLTRWGVPVFMVKNKPNDFLKRGVWLTSEHAWAVVGLTEYKSYEDFMISKGEHTDDADFSTTANTGREAPVSVEGSAGRSPAQI